MEQSLKTWTEEEAREKAARQQERERNHKIALGMIYANNRTSDWDLADAREVRAEIKDSLDAEVTAEWTDRDLHELVDELLDDWDDE